MAYYYTRRSATTCIFVCGHFFAPRFGVFGIDEEKFRAAKATA